MGRRWSCRRAFFSVCTSGQSNKQRKESGKAAIGSVEAGTSASQRPETPAQLATPQKRHLDASDASALRLYWSSCSATRQAALPSWSTNKRVLSSQQGCAVGWICTLTNQSTFPYGAAAFCNYSLNNSCHSSLFPDLPQCASIPRPRSIPLARFSMTS